MSLDLDKSTWTRCSLGDVAATSKEKVDPTNGSVDRYVAGEHMDTDDLKIHRWGDVDKVDLGPAFHRRFRPGQVLYGSRRTYLRKVAVADFAGVCANTTFVVQTADENILLQDFLPFIMSSEPFHAFAIAESKGSVNPYVNWSDIARFEFDLPPLGDQKRIADLLWAVERHAIAIRGLDREARDAVEAAVEGVWTREILRPVGAIAECVTGSTPSKSNSSYWATTDVPFYTPSEIDGTDSIQPARQKVSIAGAAAGRLLPRWSVAVACIGGEMGKSAVVLEPGISNQQITSVVGLPEEEAFTLQALLSHPRGRAAMEARETTTIVRKLNKSDLMKVEVPWPEDLSELRNLTSAGRISTRFCGAEASALTALRSAVAREIFGGN